jgi:hypothetical protein
MKRIYIILALIFSLSGCDSYVAKPEFSFFVRNAIDSNAFNVEVYKRLSTDDYRRLYHISPESQTATQLPLEMYAQSVIGDSLIIYNSYPEKAIKLYNLKTKKDSTLLPNYLCISVSQNQKFYLVQRSDKYEGKFELYSLQNESFHHVSTLHSDKYFEPVGPDRFYLTGYQTLFLSQVVDTNGNVSDHSFPIDVSEYRAFPGQEYSLYVLTDWTRKSNNNHIVHFDLVSKNIDTVFSGYHFQSIKYIPYSEYALVKCMTDSSFMARSMGISENNEVGPPDGDWYIAKYNGNKLIPLPSQNRLYAPYVSANGKFVLLIYRDDLDYQLKVVSVQELLLTQ